MTPGEPGWLGCPEMPPAAELMANKPPTLPKVDEKNTGSKAEYLETQYRLHRYEATDMLRRAIALRRQNPDVGDNENVVVFNGVRFSGYVLERQGVVCRMAFSEILSGKPVCKPGDLTPGSLVALSPQSDNFQSKCIVATVAQSRHDAANASPPVVDLLLADDADAAHAVIDPAIKLVMLEPKGGYFESLRYTMVGLQQAASFDSRFDKYLFQPFERHRTALYLKETPYHSATTTARAKQLDPSQLEALKMATSQELAIIQGPPGTGKTFTSIVAVETFIKTLQICHSNKMDGVTVPMAPIVVAAQTNHAVDQLLSRCLELGIGKIARLGGRCQDEALNEHTMAALRRRSKTCRPNGRAEAVHKNLSREIGQAIRNHLSSDLLRAEDLHDMGVINQDQFDSLIQDEWETAETDSAAEESPCAISKWLDEYVQHPEFHKARQNDILETVSLQSEPRKLKGQEFLSIEKKPLGSVLKTFPRDDSESYRAERLLSRTQDLYQIKPAERGAVYRHFYRILASRFTDKIWDLFRQFNKNCEELKMARRENDIRAIQGESIQILGCTTTGLVKNRDLLASIGPRILLIEEAAETREANIAAALLPSLEQLVLVGDHQQLTPFADLQELCRAPHRLNFSLFERLVMRKIPYCSLRVQRRMIPLLRQVVQVFYPNLQDHQVVKDSRQRPPVPGMGGCNLWWFQHQWTQNRGTTGFSYTNLKETKMIVGFTRYLVQNGVEPNEITILTYYTGQVELIKNELGRDQFLGGTDVEWSVRTIDGFQGEENDIILLSLVRGPDGNGTRAMPGFVADENRAVVATSRAKRGFYIFGNAENVLKGNNRSRQTWQKVFKAFHQRTANHIPVTCASHGAVTKMFQPEDWRSVSADGCPLQCHGRCQQCASKRHDPRLGNVACQHLCSRTMGCGHICAALCGHPCRCGQSCGGSRATHKAFANAGIVKPNVSATPSHDGSLTPGHGERDALGRSTWTQAGAPEIKSQATAVRMTFAGRHTSDEIMERGVRKMFLTPPDIEISSSDSESGMLISFEPTA